MAEAGFYYSGVSEEDDSATCFVCGKILDGWEENDEPWREHEKHAPNCKFVRLRLKQDDYQASSRSEKQLALSLFLCISGRRIHRHDSSCVESARREIVSQEASSVVEDPGGDPRGY